MENQKIIKNNQEKEKPGWFKSKLQNYKGFYLDSNDQNAKNTLNMKLEAKEANYLANFNNSTLKFLNNGDNLKDVNGEYFPLFTITPTKMNDEKQNKEMNDEKQNKKLKIVFGGYGDDGSFKYGEHFAEKNCDILFIPLLIDSQANDKIRSERILQYINELSNSNKYDSIELKSNSMGCYTMNGVLLANQSSSQQNPKLADAKITLYNAPELTAHKSIIINMKML